ncbi:thiopeptide-type bacteriocin biosynthesis protein [Streptomyces sp. NPDC047315]|uniref:thiopeptide-type bacteriocin biosynthesis protein n=1 Tax=Streptomyces sp. NPDC047315 TaxID=3155142 RepID=UPI00341025C2
MLAGTPPLEAAVRAGITTDALESAVDSFCAAGARAVEERSTAPWWQATVEFPDWTAAEQVAATHLLPVLEATSRPWWFIRKHPCWRIRLHTRDTALRASVSAALDALTAHAHLRRWRTGVHEPETAAFGGSDAMDTAHDLFHADSRAALINGAKDVAGNPRGLGLGRRELSVLLCTALLRGAGLEWYEQGDVWQRAADERPLPPDATPKRLARLANELTTLLRADLHLHGPLLGPIDLRAVGIIETNIGTMLIRTGEAEAALAPLRRALAAHHAAGNPPRGATVWREARTAFLDMPPSQLFGVRQILTLQDREPWARELPNGTKRT